MILIIPLFIACNHISDQGFTNKAEAENLLVSNYKDGKWFEYRDSSYNYTRDTNAPYYSLINYKAGKWDGTARYYYRSSKLYSEVYYNDGEAKGAEKVYYENGQLKALIPLISMIK